MVVNIMKSFEEAKIEVVKITNDIITTSAE